MEPEDSTEAFRSWLRDALTAANMSAAELARRVGVQRATVTNWLRGGRPGPKLTRRIAGALGVEPVFVQRLLGYAEPEAQTDLGVPEEIATAWEEVRREHPDIRADQVAAIIRGWANLRPAYRNLEVRAIELFGELDRLRQAMERGQTPEARRTADRQGDPGPGAPPAASAPP